MLTALSVWLCLITGVVNWTVIVNTTMHDDGMCCGNNETQCIYGSLSTALRCLKNNTVITIVSNMNVLDNITTMGSGLLNNITIIGNGATVMCNNTGGIFCNSCSNIIVKQIIWDQCGFTNHSNYEQKHLSALHFEYALNVIIQNCIFQNSSGCPVYIENAHGNFTVNSCNFSANHVYGPHDKDECVGLYINYGNADLTISVTNSVFDYNVCEPLTCGSTASTVVITSNMIRDGTKLNLVIIFEDTQFLYNPGGLFITIGYYATILLNNVVFYNNTLWGAFIRMKQIIADVATPTTLTILSSSFKNNANALRLNAVPMTIISISGSNFIHNTAADNLGAVSFISLYGQLDINISNSQFLHNSGGLYLNTNAYYGTIDLLNVTFFGNYLWGAYIKTQQAKPNNQTTMTAVKVLSSNFTNNVNGLRLFLTPVTTINISGSTFSKNTAVDKLGAVSIAQHSFHGLLDVFISSSYFLYNSGGLCLNTTAYSYYATIANVNGLRSYLTPITTINISNSTFFSNTAVDKLGAVSITQHSFHGQLNVFISSSRFLHNSGGLYLDTTAYNATIQLLHVNFSNNTLWCALIRMQPTKSNNETTVQLLMMFSTFESNENPLRINVNPIAMKPTIQKFIINGSTFVNSTATDTLGAVSFISSHGHLNMCILNNSFYNNTNGAINVRIVPTIVESDYNATTKIEFINTNISMSMSNAVGGNDAIVSIVVYDVYIDVAFEGVYFVYNKNLKYNGRVLSVTKHDETLECFNSTRNTVNLMDCIFNENSAFDHVVALMTSTCCYSNQIRIQLSNCSFSNNTGGSSITYVTAGTSIDLSPTVVIQNSTFNNNTGTAVYCVSSYLQFKKDVLFVNNSATNGAAIHCNEACQIEFNSFNISFINNYAMMKGGAIYVDLGSEDCTKCQPFSNLSYNATFTNNIAGMAGDSIYFSIPKSCPAITGGIRDSSSLLYVPGTFTDSKVKRPSVTTSPNYIELCSPVVTAQNNSAHSYSIKDSKMLGEPTKFTASIYDYFNNTNDEVVILFANCDDSCGQDYKLSRNHIGVAYESLQEIKILSTKDVTYKTNISITFSAVLSPIYNSLTVKLLISLTPCRSGYLFNNSQCICYPNSNIVRCHEHYTEIKIGHWIGFLTKQHYTSSICPNNYCNFVKRTETSQGYYNLPSKSDDQCSSHRTGVACGECKPGYTLAYYSPHCINTDKCSTGMTILVIVLIILYWIAIVAIVFGLMYFQFQISSGYAYGIIYFYSIVNALLTNTLYVSKGAFQLITVVSSFAKLTPQMLGELCLVKGLSGIDQQFIRYSHALAVSLILLIIVLVTRYSPRLAAFVSRCIIRVICLLLLLSYTCLASASLQLLRPLHFNDVDEVHTYLSPDIKYFTGRHLAYAIVAILCEVIIVIGLPMFLLLEPFLSRRINFVKIKPLLDQFQGCYKDKYRWFAAYYLICRQVIIVIVYGINQNYYRMLYFLQTACLIIAMIHIWARPYENDFLNTWDAIILLVAVLIVNLNTFTFLSSATTELAVILVLFPLFLCFLVAIRKLIRDNVMCRTCSHIEENDQGMLHDDIELMLVTILWTNI